MRAKTRKPCQTSLRSELLMETDEFGELDLCLGNHSIKSQILDAKEVFVSFKWHINGLP